MWFSKNPHCLNIMAYYVNAYLSKTKDLPLILGGNPDIEVISYANAYLGTEPKSRSISLSIIQLYASSSAQRTVRLSLFEVELDGEATEMIRNMNRITNTIDE